MKKEVDARGLACPQPVIMAKKAIEEDGHCLIIVDNEAAQENVCRMARTLGCDPVVYETGEGIRIDIVKGRDVEPAEATHPSAGPTVVVLSSDRMGQGDDELGGVLIRAFLHTLGELASQPDVIILFNAGVRLAVEGSPVIEDLHALEQAGGAILVCGTCLDFFQLKEKLAVGVISNMYDIAETMLSAGRVVNI